LVEVVVVAISSQRSVISFKLRIVLQSPVAVAKPHGPDSDPVTKMLNSSALELLPVRCTPGVAATAVITTWYVGNASPGALGYIDVLAPGNECPGDVEVTRQLALVAGVPYKPQSHTVVILFESFSFGA